MRSVRKLTLALAVIFVVPVASGQEDGEAEDAETWLPSLVTETPQEGFDLAVTLARRAVATTQPDRDVLRAGRAKYSHDPDSLIAVSEVVAVHFQTIAAANGYWRSEQQPAEE